MHEARKTTNNENKKRRIEDLKGKKEEADSNIAMLIETCHCVCEASMKKTKTGAEKKTAKKGW